MATLAHMVPLAQPGPVDGAGRKWPQVRPSLFFLSRQLAQEPLGHPKGLAPAPSLTLSAPLTSLSGSRSREATQGRKEKGFDAKG